MGARSAEPFGNDPAADWARELDEAENWDLVLDALTGVLGVEPATIDADVATVAIAAAEVVAHARGRPTQSDAYTESVTAFVERLPNPPSGIVPLALSALESAASPKGELAELWSDSGSDEWAVARASLEHPFTPLTRELRGVVRLPVAVAEDKALAPS
jgi:hypothetical protein